MIRMLGISGSLRAASLNTALLQAAKSLAGSELDIEPVTLHGIPLYDGDLEARDGLPAAVRVLRGKIQAADALLLVTPEYNNGIPGVFKNAIDWLSRTSPENPSVMAGKPTALIGASPGNFGTVLSQAHWLPVLRLLNMNVWAGGRLMVSKAHTVLVDGAIKDPAVAKQLEDFLKGYAAYIMRFMKPGDIC
jgi:chromate reductase, NAD(P)H dehydrogenase (quinone)